MENLDIIITHALGGAAVFAVGVAFGWFLRERAAIVKVNKMFAQMEVADAKAAQENKITATLEIHHGHFYMFDKETGKFLGQGETKEELSSVLRERFPDKVFILPSEDCDILGV